MRKLTSFVFHIIIPVVIAFFFIQTILHIGITSSASMNPTLKTNSVIIANKLAYKEYDVQRGDIVVFFHENDEYVKRIIGLPGEQISFIDGKVFVNGSLLDEPYIEEDMKTYSSEVFQVPENSYFVLGDNRDAGSNDSRYMTNTYVEKEVIIGRVFYVFNELGTGSQIPKYKEK